MGRNKSMEGCVITVRGPEGGNKQTAREHDQCMMYSPREICYWRSKG